jgi:hypothetical protein
VNNKTNIFVCALVVLSINLQCNISAYAEDKNTATVTTEQQDLDSVEIIQAENAVDAEITNGVDLSAVILDPDINDQPQ